MIDYTHIIILSLVQGITEFLPISSSAHLFLIPKILGWNDQGVFLDVSMHFGSLLAFIYYYFKNTTEFINAEYAKNYIDIQKIIIGSLPVLFFGYFFHDYIVNHLRNLQVIAISSILVAIFILLAEFFSKKSKNISKINNIDMVIIGLFQALALIPGTSRSAIIVLSALILGYNKKSSIIIAIILAFPVIFIAMCYETLSLNFSSINIEIILSSFVSIILSFLTAYLVIKYFILYINKIGFYPFMIYRLILGVIILSIFT